MLHNNFATLLPEASSPEVEWKAFEKGFSAAVERVVGVGKPGLHK